MKGHQDSLRLKHLSGEECLRGMDLFSLENRWLQGEVRAFRNPQGSYQEDGARLFTVVFVRKMRDKGCKLEQEMIMLDIKIPPRGKSSNERVWTRGCVASLHARSFQDPAG